MIINHHRTPRAYLLQSTSRTYSIYKTSIQPSSNIRNKIGTGITIQKHRAHARVCARAPRLKSRYRVTTATTTTTTTNCETRYTLRGSKSRAAAAYSIDTQHWEKKKKNGAQIQLLYLVARYRDCTSLLQQQILHHTRMRSGKTVRNVREQGAPPPPRVYKLR